MPKGAEASFCKYYQLNIKTSLVTINAWISCLGLFFFHLQDSGSGLPDDTFICILLHHVLICNARDAPLGLSEL